MNENRRMPLFELPWLTEPKDERGGWSIAVVIVQFVVTRTDCDLLGLVYEMPAVERRIVEDAVVNASISCVCKGTYSEECAWLF